MGTGSMKESKKLSYSHPTSKTHSQEDNSMSITAGAKENNKGAQQVPQIKQEVAPEIP